MYYRNLRLLVKRIKRIMFQTDSFRRRKLKLYIFIYNIIHIILELRVLLMTSLQNQNQHSNFKDTLKNNKNSFVVCYSFQERLTKLVCYKFKFPFSSSIIIYLYRNYMKFDCLYSIQSTNPSLLTSVVLRKSSIISAKA